MNADKIKMDLYKRIIEIVDVNLIYCLIPMILSLLLVEFFFKNRFETKKVLDVIRWIIIVYAIVVLIQTLIEIAMHPKEFTDRIAGVYKITYWLMLFAALILPFTLFIKKLASNFIYILFVALCMKSGFYVELFVILVTSYHRDYLTENGNTEPINSIVFSVGMIFLQGIIITMLILGIFEISKRRKGVHNA